MKLILYFLLTLAFSVKASEVKTAGEKPILLYFSSEYCPYCELLEEKFLQSEISENNLNLKVKFIKVEISDNSKINNHCLDLSVIKKELAIRVTPTMLWLNPKTLKVIEKPLVGVSNIEFYSYYFTKMNNLAIEKVKKDKSALVQLNCS